MALYPTDTIDSKRISIHIDDTNPTQQRLTHYLTLRAQVIKQLQTNLRLTHEIIGMENFPMEHARAMMKYRDQLWARLKVCQMVHFSGDPAVTVDGIVAALEVVVTEPMPCLPPFADTQQGIGSEPVAWMGLRGQEVRRGVQVFDTSEVQKVKKFDLSSWTWVDADVVKILTIGMFGSEDMNWIEIGG